MSKKILNNKKVNQVKRAKRIAVKKRYFVEICDNIIIILSFSISYYLLRKKKKKTNKREREKEKIKAKDVGKR